MKKLLLFILILSLKPVFSYETISGNINSQTWSNETYYISSTLTINEGETLTISPGTIVKLAPQVSLVVNGNLEITGTEENRVHITSKHDNTYGELIEGSTGTLTGNQWRTIYVNNIANINYCDILYSGAYGSDMMLVSNSAILTLDNSEIKNCLGNGIYVDGALLSVENTSFNNIAGKPLYLSNTDFKVFPGLVFSNNGYNGVYYSNNHLREDLIITESLAYPLIFASSLYIDPGVILSIPAGQVCKFIGTASLYNNGSLICNGNENNPVVFTSIKDDSYGGDTNNDGNASSPSVSDWGSINCTSPEGYVNNSSFNNTVFAYGGYVSEHVIYIQDNENVQVENCLFKDNYKALYVKNSNLSMNNNVFENNFSYSVYLREIEYQNYLGNEFVNNGYNGIVVQYCTFAQDIEVDTQGTVLILEEANTILEGVTVTFAAGQVVKFKWNGRIYNNGSLICNGTEAEPVVFTSIKDDCYGGDTNNDGNASTPAFADWMLIENSGLADNDETISLTNTMIRYGGYAFNCGMTISGYSNVQIDNLTMYQNYNGLKVFLSDCDIVNSNFQNNGYGISIERSDVNVRNSNFDDTGNDIHINTTSNVDLGTNESLGHNRFGFVNLANYFVYNTISNNVSAIGNQFNVGSNIDIDSHIYDFNDNYNYGQVSYLPLFVEEALIYLTHDELVYEDTYVGLQESKEIEINNNGTIDLQIDSIEISNPAFTLDANLTLPLIINPDASTSIIITYTPLAELFDNATVVINNNSSNNSELAFALTGRGMYDDLPAPLMNELFLQSGNALISWNPVTQTNHGINIAPDFYVISYSEIPSDNLDDYYHLTITSENEFLHRGVTYFSPQMFYRVTAVKDYDGLYLNEDKEIDLAKLKIKARSKLYYK